MPCFMYEMAVAGYGINLTAFFLEFVIFILEIFQFSGANKSEVSGIEEKDTPFACQVLVRNLYKFALLVSI